MSKKYTPGPWNEDGVFVCDDEDNIICELYEINPNARLIAAAPDLFEALKDLTADISERFDMNSPSTNPGIKFCIERAHAAIRKALGEEK